MYSINSYIVIIVWMGEYIGGFWFDSTYRLAIMYGIFINNVLRMIKMIKVEVKDYCQRCPEFESDTTMNQYACCGNATTCDTTIRCKYRIR